LECWPAFMEETREVRAMTPHEIRTTPIFDLELGVLCVIGDRCQYMEYIKKRMEDNEYMMKQVNCASKNVRAELIHTAGASQYVNVALALAAR
jgi:hypothetical protein